MKLALAGNPNSGKTTMFNILTGSYERVGNWAGVTVDKKEREVRGKYCKGCKDVTVIDLPGTYSMTPFTSEESITGDFIKKEKPDVIINIVDGTNLSRSLFLTTQLCELGIPVVVALNKEDVNRKNGIEIDEKILSELLFCPVTETVSLNGKGLSELIELALKSVGRTQTAPYIGGGEVISDEESAKKADADRFEFVKSIVSKVEVRKRKTSSVGDKIDKILTDKWLGIPIFALVMLFVFVISQSLIGPILADALTGFLEGVQEHIREFFADSNPLLSAILVDGVIGGVIAVIGFLPLVMVMYLLIALLEDCGYMARVAVVLDPIFKRVGLSGRSVIPFVIAVGCAVPGVMASRTIKDERERRATAMLAPFMPCGAKIPVIALFAGAFFGGSGIISTVCYLLGIVIIFFGALLVRGITGTVGKKSYFIIELPDYKVPGIWNAVKSMLSRGKEYVVKATTIILLCNTAVQIMQSFTPRFTVAESASESILAYIAQPFAYAIYPIVGVLSWQLAAAAVTGFIAKENVVGTLAVCFAGLENLIDTEELILISGGDEVAGVMAISKAAALAYLMFNLYSPPCFAAIGAMSAEMKSKRWLFGGIALQLFVGYAVAYVVYTFGTLIFGGEIMIVPTLCGAAVVLAGAGIVGSRIRRNL